MLVEVFFGFNLNNHNNITNCCAADSGVSAISYDATMIEHHFLQWRILGHHWRSWGPASAISLTQALKVALIATAWMRKKPAHRPFQCSAQVSVVQTLKGGLPDLRTTDL